MLAGRAVVRELFPLTSLEVGGQFDLQNALVFGTLPKIFALQTMEEKNSKIGNSHMDIGIYKYRHLVENIFARSKHNRAVATR